MSDCTHEWTPDETGQEWLCGSCEQTCPACNTCGGPTRNALLICQRCLDAAADVLDGITAALGHYLPPQPASVGVSRYDTDRRGPTVSRGTSPFSSPGDIEDVLLSWVAMWTELSGVAENVEPVDYLKGRHLWAAHNVETSAWEDYRAEMRALRHHARRLAGLLPQRQSGACIYCGGIVVRDWADEEWKPRTEGLSDELRCSACRTAWENPQAWRFANRHTILALPDTHPESLVTREQARSIYPTVPAGTWRQWFHRDAKRGEGQLRYREMLESGRIGPAPEPERMPVQAWDVRGAALYRLGDLDSHVRRWEADTRPGRKVKTLRAG